MTEATLNKLEEAFAMGCSDREACFFANISSQTLYNYQKDNPEFVERKAMLKENPVLLARTTVVEAIKGGNVNTSTWLLERKAPDMRTKQDVDITSKGEAIHNGEAVKELSDKFNDFLRTQE